MSSGTVAVEGERKKKAGDLRSAPLALKTGESAAKDKGNVKTCNNDTSVSAYVMLFMSRVYFKCRPIHLTCL